MSLFSSPRTGLDISPASPAKTSFTVQLHLPRSAMGFILEIVFVPGITVLELSQLDPELPSSGPLRNLFLRHESITRLRLASQRMEIVSSALRPVLLEHGKTLKERLPLPNPFSISLHLIPVENNDGPMFVSTVSLRFVAGGPFVDLAFWGCESLEGGCIGDL